MDIFLGPSVINGNIVYRVWKDGIIVFQDFSLDKAQDFEHDLLNPIVVQAPDPVYCDILTKEFDVEFSEKTYNNTSKKIIHITEVDTGDVKCVCLIQETFANIHILFIATPQSHLKKGYAKRIINYLKETFPTKSITTKINSFNIPSLNFFTKQRFLFESFNMGTSRLYYTMVFPATQKLNNPKFKKKDSKPDSNTDSKTDLKKYLK
jgi:hypothetical protein